MTKKNNNLPVDWNHLWQNRRMTRTWYCKYCASRGYPAIGMPYVLYRRSTGNFLPKTVTNIKNRTRGFVPAFIELVLDKTSKYYSKKEGYISVLVSCCTIGCGLNLVEKKKGSGEKIVEHRRTFIYELSITDVLGLIRFNNSGFEVDYNNELKWKLRK